MNLLSNQAAAETKLAPFKVGALFMEAGTGKTRVAVDLIRDAKPDFVAWIGPLRTIKPLDNLPSVVDEVNKWGSFGVDTVFVGIESLQNSDRVYLELYNRIVAAKRPFIVVDESIKIKNATAKRTRRMLELGRLAEFKLVLNGTPISRNLLDLKPQMDFLSPLILNMGYADFKNNLCEYTRVTKSFGGRKSYTKEYITGYENIDYLYSLIRHYVFECSLSLAVKQLYSTVNYSLSKEHADEYARLKAKFLDNEYLQWKNNNIFIEMTQKMQHVYCCTPDKFSAVETIFKEIDQSRTIIFCKFVDSADACREKFPKATVLSYQKSALGLNLQHLNNTIYFDKHWDYAQREHSTRRTFRTGQEYDCRYWDLTGNVGLESLIDANIQKKIGMVEYFKGKTKEEIRDML